MVILQNEALKIEAVGDYSVLQVRETTTVDGVTSHFRYVVTPADDASIRPSEVQDAVATHHTQAIKDAYLASLS